ncbi:MAG: S8 family serine peptidase [Bacteroidetes bacterium]|nr:S8 family serine peptidase [Bacteroidota bacterium]
MRNIFIFIFVIIFILGASSQTSTNKGRLEQLSSQYYQKSYENRLAVIEYSKKHNIPIRYETDSTLFEIMYVDQRGNPQYYTTNNAVAAATSSTTQVYSGGAAGLNLDGAGISVCEWDAGSVLTTHQEFNGRVTNMDILSVHYHSTHVAGTIMASGVVSDAKGMAYAASLKSYDWNEDNAEMANEASNGNMISNHSYSWIRGWYGSTWYGDPAISTSEDYLFGFYDYSARDWDEIALNAPYYLVVKSAGNDRGNAGDGSYPPDGPYDCIPQKGIAKNILTVGAVNDIPLGYSLPTDVGLASFSSCGPADDGRIKPDIVANGIGLYSTDKDADDDYRILSGTSMSAPATTGSLALLMQHYENVKGSGVKMRSATLKALVLHTADESGLYDGPDYEFGWGLLNTQSAAAKITEDQTTDFISEHVLANGETYIRNITTTGTSPIRVTVVWTDPPGTPPADALDPPDIMLVNDLDLRITESSNTYYPWKLDKDIPTNAATNLSENNVDNVEMVDIASPITATTYTIIVDHDGTLAAPQAFSIIISGDIENAVAPITDFFADNTEPGVSQNVLFTDATDNVPISWSWTFNPTTVQYINGTTSFSSNPEVEFTTTGTYDVSLYTANATGNDTETKTGYITVGDAPSNYCIASSDNPFGYISRVQIGSVDNTSGYSANSPYYQDWTANTAGVVVSHSHYITIINGSYDADNDIAIWIDWNRDGDFEDANETIIYIDNNYGQGTFLIDVPIDAEIGQTRMRIRTKYYDDNAYSCGSTWYGEVEDYTIEVHPCITWSGLTDTNWSESTNWVGGVIPTSTDGVTIPTGASVEILTGTSITCFSLKLEGNSTLSVYGNLEIEN